MAPAVLDRERVKEEQPSTEPMRDGYSLVPYPVGEAPFYYNPIDPGCTMLWHSKTEKDRMGFALRLAKHTWHDGKFSPTNPWENAMTREWIIATYDNRYPPDRWQGDSSEDVRPERTSGNPWGHWVCQCTWHCGNRKAFDDHRMFHKHQESLENF